MEIWTNVHPGTEGISYGAALRLLEALEAAATEPHALVIMRHGNTAV